MMKHILATSALATLLATGLNAQTEPAADPAQDPAAPIVEGTEGTDAPIVEGAEGTMDGSAEPNVAASPDGNMDDGVMTPDTTAADDVEPMDGAADPMVAEPADTMEGDATVATPADPMEGDATVAGDWAPIDLTTISTDQLIGADIMTHENETIATIEDVLISDDGQVESLVARFGGFLGFGSDQVLLTPDEVEVMMDADESLLVRTDLTPEGLEGRPVYEDEAVEG